MDYTYYVSLFYSYMAVLANILVVLLIIAFIAKKYVKNDALNKILNLINGKVVLWGFIISLLAVLGSLYYSEIAHYNPCKLCWFQRIFMYPLPFIFGVALIKKSKEILPYALTLSVIGGLIAAYHYFLQVQSILFPNVEIITPCSVVGYAPSCAEYFTLQLGYVTIPMMSFSAFALMTVILAYSMIKKKG